LRSSAGIFSAKTYGELRIKEAMLRSCAFIAGD